MLHHLSSSRVLSFQLLASQTIKVFSLCRAFNSYHTPHNSKIRLHKVVNLFITNLPTHSSYFSLVFLDSSLHSRELNLSSTNLFHNSTQLQFLVILLSLVSPLSLPSLLFLFSPLLMGVNLNPTNLSHIISHHHL